MRLRNIVARTAAVLLTCGFFSAAAFGQSYPQRAVRLIVPFAPGGIYDYVARLVAPKMSEVLGHTMVVDNRAGGGGVIAMQLASKATPDGYTVLLADPSLVNNLHLHSSAPYDLKDLAPVTILTTASLVLAVNAKVPVNSVKELIEHSKTTNLNYGTAGIGSVIHWNHPPSSSRLTRSRPSLTWMSMMMVA